MSPYLTSNPTSREGQQTTNLYNAAPHLDVDPVTLPTSTDPFTVTTTSGFMPSKLPIVDLPSAFSAMAKLADEMPIQKLDGLPGLLATYQLGPRIDRGDLPDLTAEIDNLTTFNSEPDLHLVSAIFRDYSFLASAYLLEPCWEEWEKNGKGYGLGRQVLPRCLAGPLVKTAKMLDIPPFMAYAAAYSLYNYRFADHSIGYDDYNNLRLIRAFERGLDPKSSEAGFILTHVDMVKHSGSLVKGAVDLLKATEFSNHASAVDALDVLLESMTVIEASMETMWTHSKPKEYLNYRTFIFGITNQTMFPNGVVYEGENEGRPMNFRGESGANDAMIPLLDSLLQIQMPPNPLTTILKDFRNYRPKPHRDFLAAVRREAEDLGVRTFACKDLDTRVRYLRLLNHVRSFRWRHWMFTREYIIKYSSHPTATGGSPIILWLPNQLFAVMDMMVEVWDGVTDEEKAIVGLRVNSMMDEVEECRAKLRKEVDSYCSERGQ